LVSKEIFLGRQPILDDRQNLVAYELLFRSSASINMANMQGIHKASEDVIINALCDFGDQDVLGKHKGFINVEPGFLMTDTIELLPKDRVVIEILETTRVDKEIIDRCRELKKIGFSLALDDFTPELRSRQNYDPLLEIVDIVKIDIMDTPSPELSDFVRYAFQFVDTLLAEKVESQEQFKRCQDLGFTLFQGYYFAKPVILSRRRIDVSNMTLMKLLEQVLSDAEPKDIENTFKQSPQLAYNMLRLVNSVGMEMHSEIRTLRHAIVVLGREQLKRWVELLLFTHGSAAPSQNPLLHMAATRGRLMELLRKAPSFKDNDNDSAGLSFMIGILSLLDTLLNMPMSEIVEQLNLNSEMNEALLHRRGIFGDLLTLVEGLEQEDFSTIEELSVRLSLPPSHIFDSQLEAIKWTNRLTGSL